MARVSNEVHERYVSKAYDQIKLTVPKGRRADVQAYADRQNTSVNALINELLRYELGMTEAAWKARKDDNID